MTAAFQPGQQVRCVVQDNIGETTIRIGDVLTVGDLVCDGRGFRPPNEQRLVYLLSARFVSVYQPGPWIEHTDEACPVGPGVMVEVRLRSGRDLCKTIASDLSWLHYGVSNDIIAWRIADWPAPAPNTGREMAACKPGIAAIKSEIERLARATSRREIAYRDSLQDALAHLGIRTTIHPPRVEFTEAEP